MDELQSKGGRCILNIGLKFYLIKISNKHEENKQIQILPIQRSYANSNQEPQINIQQFSCEACLAPTIFIARVSCTASERSTILVKKLFKRQHHLMCSVRDPSFK
jgi:hypothetical protein